MAAATVAMKVFPQAGLMADHSVVRTVASSAGCLVDSMAELKAARQAELLVAC